MDQLRSFLRDLRDDDSGVVLTEWVVVAGILVLASIVLFFIIGQNVNLVVDAVCTMLETGLGMAPDGTFASDIVGCAEAEAG